jgi:DNA-binding NarL/FixJ family response regulator
VALQGTTTANPRGDAAETAVAVVTADQLAIRRIGDVLEETGLGPITVSGSADALLASGPESWPDVVVFSCAGTDAALLAAIRELASSPMATHIVVVVPEGGLRGFRQALAAGATGLLYESQLEAALLPTIRAALAGQTCVPRRLRRSVVKPCFSHREKQVLAMVVRGLTNQQIGDRLYLAESTVKSHLGSAFEKLGVHSRTEAAAMLLDPNEGLSPSVLGGDWRGTENGGDPDSYEIPPHPERTERTLEG